MEETKLDETTKSNDLGATEAKTDNQTNTNEPQPSQSANVTLADNVSGDMVTEINKAQNIETQNMAVEATGQPLENQDTGVDFDARNTVGAPTGQEAQTEEALEDQSLFDLLYGVIARPVATFKYLSVKKPWVMAIVLYIAVAFISAVAGVPGQQDQLSDLTKLGGNSNINIGAIVIVALVIVLPIFSFIGLLIIGGIYHLLARAFKGNGSYKGMISTLGFAGFPSIVSTPFSLLYFIGGPIGKIIAVVTTLSVSFIVGIWILVLNILAIRENYKLSTGKAVAVCLIPVAVVIVLLVILLTILIAIVATQIPDSSL
jgi:hypothetical protein